MQNKLIYEAFTEQHGVEIGKFMMEHFIEERQYFSEEIRIYMRDLVLNHPVHMGFITKIEKNGEMKDIWFAC